MNPLLELVPPADRANVEASATRVARDNRAWAGALLGPAGPRYCDNLAFAVAAIAPALPTARLDLLTRFCLWTFLLDTRIEDARSSPAELHGVTDDIVRVTSGAPPSVDGDPLMTTLAGLLTEFRALDGAAALWNRLVNGVRDATAAGVAQTLLTRAIARGERPPPAAEDYLDLASRHINYRSVVAALLLLLDVGRVEEFLDQVDEALGWASRAVRLANDRGSAERDQAEGTLNVLSLSTRGGAPVTQAAVTDQIHELVTAHDKLVAALPAEASSALVNSLRVSVGVYQVGDLR